MTAMPSPKRVVVVTNTGEPVQPTRLYLTCKSKHGVEEVLRQLECVWRDADRAGFWMWMYTHEAEAITLGKRPSEVPELARPVVLAEMSFPKPGRMLMRFRSPDRAIEAAKFFSPRFGALAVPDRIRILNRLVTTDEISGLHAVDGLLDQRVTIIDPEVQARKIEEALDSAHTKEEKLAAYQRYQEERRKVDVPEVEDFPLAMEEETATFTHLTMTLRLRSVRAVERWAGKQVSLMDIIYRMFGQGGEGRPGDADEGRTPLTR
jgi:hypothetical protein